MVRAKWAAGMAHLPPRPGTTGTQRQHATWATALLGRLPRLPSLGRVLARAKAEYKWCKPALREERRRIVYMLSWWLFARDCHRAYDRVRVMR